jgi:hypothetical protein
MIKEDVILSKISELLGLTFDQECHVVYLMVEIRKLLEYNQKFSDFSTLALYCDWCVHVKLDRKSAKNKLAEIEKYFGDNNEIKNDIYPTFLEFSELKDELSLFFKRNDLKSVNFFDNWNKFKKNLVNILANCPLILKPNEDKKIEAGKIKRLYFEKTIRDDGSLICNIDFEKDSKGICRSFSVGRI